MDKYIKFFKSQITLIAIAAAAIIFFVYRYFKAKSDSVADERPAMPNIPDGGVNIGPNYEATAKKIAAQVFDAIDGLFVLSSTKEKAFNTLWNLTDDQLVYVYLTYNHLYFNEHRESMTKSIRNEWYFTNSIKDELVKRLVSLGAE